MDASANQTSESVNRHLGRDKDKQTTRGLRIEEQVYQFSRDVICRTQSVTEVLEIAAEARIAIVANEIHHACEQWNLRRLDLQRKPACNRDLGGVAYEAEACDVGAGVNR
jgi:hypothetical protein